MTIEVRPARVQDQIAEKRRRLSDMKEQLAKMKENILYFSNNNELEGESFNTARKHFSEYLRIIDGFLMAIYKVETADKTVENFLSKFGGASKVSEQELLDAQQQAQNQIEVIDGKVEDYKATMKSDPLSKLFAFTALGTYDTQKRSWENSLHLASETLSKLYSYCDNTNNLHSNTVGNLCTAISKGVDAMRKSLHDGVWIEVDDSWKASVDEYLDSGDPEALLARSLGGEVIYDENGQWLYINGKRYDLLDEEDSNAAAEILQSMGKDGVNACFDTVDYCISNQPDLSTAGKRAASAIGKGNAVVGTLITAYTATAAYNNGYSKGRDNDRYSEDERRSNAESAAAKELTGAGISLGTGLIGMCIGQIVCPIPGVGAIAGGAVGSLIGSVATNAIFNSDFDGNHVTLSQEIDEKWYTGGAHQLVSTTVSRFTEPIHDSCW